MVSVRSLKSPADEDHDWRASSSKRESPCLANRAFDSQFSTSTQEPLAVEPVRKSVDEDVVNEQNPSEAQDREDALDAYLEDFVREVATCQSFEDNEFADVSEGPCCHREASQASIRGFQEMEQNVSSEDAPQSTDVSPDHVRLLQNMCALSESTQGLSPRLSHEVQVSEPVGPPSSESQPLQLALPVSSSVQLGLFISPPSSQPVPLVSCTSSSSWSSPLPSSPPLHLVVPPLSSLSSPSSLLSNTFGRPET